MLPLHFIIYIYLYIPEKKPSPPQECFSVDIWMGLMIINLTDPHFLPYNLNGDVYEHILREK